MSMMKKNFEARNITKNVTRNEVSFDGLGLESWGETKEVNPESYLIPWGTEAEQELANQALVNHFASRR